MGLSRVFKPLARPGHLSDEQASTGPDVGLCRMPDTVATCDWSRARWDLAQAEEVVDELQRAREAAEERRLVLAAAEGSSVAFEALYRRHVPRVYALCLRMTGQVAAAEDCTQEAFIQAWRNLSRFETRSAFGTWLHRIAVNAVLQQSRRRRESLGTADSVERELGETLPDLGAEDPAAGRDLETAIAALPAGARHVLVLVGVYGHSHEDAAQLLGIAVGTCKAQLHRARALLATRLDEEESRR
jgi:RNA polymerase sigma-70 factor (ECF subfamily)